ncbi:hypothetical protein CPB84DRAFT_1751026 [Gymnopilus junonius]|uniref:Protein kinase domain-containing protein n=1 Tax=Gymnopilus junonius TaxID=109634 RepID=A0A9P5THL4_GYMJU|nr:hypothetical protein CPB84DRAFT_1751026 [Gymnopilus junonius]
MPGPSSLRSRLSGSSTSSLSSTFSDITSATTSSVHSEASNSNSKTNAFFASPWSTHPPSPTPSPPPAPPPKPRSLTEEFFSTPARPPSPPASSIVGAASKQNAIHPSRIFPSRYTSHLRSPHSQSHLINFDHLADSTARAHSHSHPGHERESSDYSNPSSCSSSFAEPRLPTPPPSASISRRSLHRDDTIMPIDFTPPHSKDEAFASAEEATPRPADLEPNLLHFERSLLLKHNQGLITEDEDGEDPHPGSIIELSALPLSPLSINFSIASPDTSIDRGTPTPTNESSNFAPSFSTTTPGLSYSPESVASPLPRAPEPAELTETPRLRLVKSLGHGAFSAVWLAEDLSRVPLTLVSKKSVRDLRRRASGKGRDRERREREKERARKERRAIEMKALPPPPPEVPLKTTETTPTPATARRPPNRLREGLRNMLSFSRTSSVVPAMPSPISSSLSGASEDNTLSRNSSIKSLPSIASDRSSLSRDSSVRSSTSISKEPSRNSSLRLALHRQFEEDEEGGHHIPRDAAAASLSRDSSLRKFRARVRGTKPASRLGRAYLDERDGEMGTPMEFAYASQTHSASVPASDGRRSRKSSLASTSTASAASNSNFNGGGGIWGTGRLVAVKMTPRKPRGPHARAYLPSKYHAAPSPPLHLDASYPRPAVFTRRGFTGVGESVLRRIWCELCKAVGWMHGVGLVHRDIKLENILLTTPIFTSLTPTSPAQPSPTSPHPSTLIKLTDFGLSREAYAAPELVTGASGGYDARRTDAWACGVVLYALVGRGLPFGEGVGGEGKEHKIGGERGWRRRVVNGEEALVNADCEGEWEWPAGGGGGGGGERSEMSTGEPMQVHEHEEEELPRGEADRWRLLVRDPRKRARIVDLWDDVWMQGGFSASSNSGQQQEGEGPVSASSNVLVDEEAESRTREETRGYGSSPLPPAHARARAFYEEDDLDKDEVMRDDREPEEEEDEYRFYDQPSAFGRDYFFEGEDGSEGYGYEGEGEEGVEEAEDPFVFGDGGLDAEEGLDDEEEEEGGCLFDHEGIDSITRREVV